MTDALDVSGDWLGVFSYPGDHLPPVSFTAILSERSGDLEGIIEESGSAGTPVCATLRGRRAGQATTWLKSYDDSGYAEEVSYDGEVSDDAEEISGRWSIFGDWSGTFLMVRQKRAGRERQANVAAGRRERR